jgi:aquaporin Z
MTRKLIAEFIGTFMLVASVCGAALFSVPVAGLMTVAFAIGTAVLAMAYAVGSISGGHFNPAVTCGLVAAGRFSAAEVIPYIISQVIGGIVAATIFYFILSGAPAGRWNDFIAISNIYGGEGHFPLAQVALIEIILTALFLIVSVTSPKVTVGFAPIAIGLTLTFIHLVAIPVDNASVNPARSTATAIFGGGVALGSLWLFWVAPIVGGVIGGLIARWLQEE